MPNETYPEHQWAGLLRPSHQPSVGECMTRIFYETIAQVILVAVFGEAIFRFCAAFLRAALSAPKKPCQSVTEFDEWEKSQW